MMLETTCAAALVLANVLVLVDDGVPTVSTEAALLALAISAVIGYLAIGALMRLVRQIPFWAVCVGFGGLAVVGGLLVLVV
jgi:undecaprenyl-diphosphatase